MMIKHWVSLLLATIMMMVVFSSAMGEEPAIEEAPVFDEGTVIVAEEEPAEDDADGVIIEAAMEPEIAEEEEIILGEEEPEEGEAEAPQYADFLMAGEVDDGGEYAVLAAAENTIIGDVIVDGGQTICDKSISGNIFVPRGSTLQLSGTVSITGDVFIWGTLNNNGTLTVSGTLNCLHYGSMISAGSYDYGYFNNSGKANINTLNVKDNWLSTVIPGTNSTPAPTASPTPSPTIEATVTPPITESPYRAYGSFGPTEQGWEWHLTVDGTLVISGNGIMPNVSNELPWSKYVEDIHVVRFEEGVTHIGNSVMGENEYSKSWRNIKSVVFPASLIQLLEGAFYNCHLLSEIIFSDNNRCHPISVMGCVFCGCQITRFCPPRGIGDIGEGAFENCWNLEKISLAHNCTFSISSAFNGCTKLKDVYYDGTNIDGTKLILGDNELLKKATWHYTEIIVTDVTLDKTMVNLDVKGTVTLTATVAPANATNKTVTWESSNKTIATVDANGKVTAKLPGTATITVKTANGKTATCFVTVNAPAPTKITLPTQISIGLHETRDLLPVLTPSYADTTYTYRFSNIWPLGYHYDETWCKIWGERRGKTVITVTTANGLKAKTTVMVKKAPKKVTLSPKSIILNVGQKSQLKATLPKNTASAVTYTSSNEKVATVDANGIVTAVTEGTVTITARTFNNKTATCKVTVITGKAPTGLTMNMTSVKLGKGQKVKIVPTLKSGENTIYTFTSSRKKVATVAVDGTITGKKKGKAVITVKTHNGIKKTVTVTVSNAPKKVTLSAKTLILNVGASGKLTAKLPKGTYSPITFTSDKTAIATVDASGNVKAVKAGTATITAKTFNNKTANCVVTVLTGTAPTSVTVPEATITLAKGSTYKIVPKLNSGANTVFTYTAKNKTKNKKKIATVSADGTITAKVKGTAIITVKTHNGKTATVTVIVK